MDGQIILLVILSLLVINLVVVGIYVVIVLREFRETIKKMNTILDDVSHVSSSLSAPLSNMSGLINGVTQGLSIFNSVKSLKSGGKR